MADAAVSGPFARIYPKTFMGRDTSGLIPWHLAQDAVISGVDIGSTSPDSGDYCVKGDVTAMKLSIPAKLWLNAAKALSNEVYGEGLRAIMLHFMQSDDEDVQFAEREVVLAFLCCVKASQSGMGSPPASSLAPYVAALPDAVDLPSIWPEGSAKLRCLKGTELARAVAAKRHSIVAEHALFAPVVTATFAKLLPDTSGWFTVDLWKWADAVYWSRVFSLEEMLRGMGVDAVDAVMGAMFQAPPALCDRCMVPLIDFLNHSNEPNVQWTLALSGDDDGNMSAAIELIAADGGTVPATVSASSGAGSSSAELCISYGDKPNAEFLFHYGFVCYGPSADSCGLPLPIPDMSDASAELTEAKLSVMFALNYSKPVFRVCAPDSDCPPSADLTGKLCAVLGSYTELIVLRVMLAEDTATVETLANVMLGAASAGLESALAPVSAANEAAVLHFILSSIRTALGEMATPAELSELPDDVSSQHVKLFVEVQRAVLSAALEFLAPPGK